MNRKEMIKRLEAGEDPLDLSIEKWDDIFHNVGEDRGWSNCALCYMYYHNMYYHNYIPECNLCPVYSYTKQQYCKRTPYEKYIRHLKLKMEESEDGLHPRCSICNELIKEELEFLKMLKNKKEEAP